MKWHDDISRMGYDDEGCIYSIICPQQGQGSAFIGELNIEATVTGCRGWVKEDEYTMFADLGVIAQIWYTPDVNNPIQKAIAKVLDSKNLPTSKENSIKIPVHSVGQPWNSVFTVQNGTSPEFRQPESTQHDREAYGVGHFTIEIDEMKKTGNEKVDDFNQVILDIFNIAFGNMLAKGQRVSWNVCTGEPEKVDQDEWHTHSERWRKSLEKHHCYPDGTNKFDDITYYDGTPLDSIENFIHKEAKLFKVFLAKHENALIDEELDVVTHIFNSINDKFIHPHENN